MPMSAVPHRLLVKCRADTGKPSFIHVDPNPPSSSLLLAAYSGPLPSIALTPVAAKSCALSREPCWPGAANLLWPRA